MDNGKCIMDNDCVAKGDDFKSFPKEIPQLSIINYQLSIRASARQTGIGKEIAKECFFPELLPNQVFTFLLFYAKLYLVRIWICREFSQQNTGKTSG